MNRLKRIGLMFCVLLVFLSIGVAAFPLKTYAYDGSGALYHDDPHELNHLDPNGDTAMAKLAASVSVKFLDIGHINVTVGLTDPLIVNKDDLNTSPTKSFGEVYSSTGPAGTYTMSKDKTEWYSKPVTLRKDGGGSNIYATGVIKTENRDDPVPDLTKASPTEISNWIGKGLRFYALIYAYDSGIACGPTGCDSNIYGFLDEIDDNSKPSWQHQCVNNSSVGSCLEVGQEDVQSIYSAFHADPPLTSTVGNFADRSTYKGAKIDPAKLDAVASTSLYTFSIDTITADAADKDGNFLSYPYCDNLHAFQTGTCSGNGAIIFEAQTSPVDPWGVKSKADILKLFDPAGSANTPVPATLGDIGKKKLTPILVLGAKSDSALHQGATDPKSNPDIKINCDWDVFNPLTWFLCPLIDGGAQVVTKLDAEINDQLVIKIGSGSNYDQTSVNGKGLYSAWSAMRTIALSLLVLIALVMVISQAISIGPFDAYTVKKVLPRIVIAVIAITLSWQLVKLAINISNDLGQGISTIMSKPFEGLGHNPTVKLSGGVDRAVGVVGTIAGLFSGLDLLAVGSFLLVGLAAVFIALIVIVFRSILITLLVITAPLAMIAWILPNTQKVWKIWVDNMQAGLLSFPLIVAFITSGRIFSKITSNSQGGLFANIIVFLAYFGPYFALPFAFRLAGGAISSLGGLANDRGKGFFDRNRKYRDVKKKAAQHRRASGNTFTSAGDTGIRASLNRRIGQGYATKQLGVDPRKWRGRLERTHVNHEIAESNAMLKDEEYTKAGDDNWNYAALAAGDSSEFRSMMASYGRQGTNLDEDVAQYELMRGRYRQGMKLAAFERTAAGGTVFGVKGNMSSMEAAAHISHGNTGLQAYLDGKVRSVSQAAGRPDEGLLSHGSAMAASNSVNSGFLQNENHEYVDGYGAVLADPANRVASNPDAVSRYVARRSFQQSHGSQWMGPGIKRAATQKGVEMLREDIGHAVATGNSQLLAESYAKYDEMRTAATTSEGRELLANGVSRLQVDAAGNVARDQHGNVINGADLSQMSEAQLRMYGDSIYETEEYIRDGGGEVANARATRIKTETYQDPATGVERVRKALKKNIYSNAELLDLSLGSQEMKEVSKQYAQSYENRSQPPGEPPTPPLSPL